MIIHLRLFFCKTRLLGVCTLLDKLRTQAQVAGLRREPISFAANHSRVMPVARGINRIIFWGGLYAIARGENCHIYYDVGGARNLGGAPQPFQTYPKDGLWYVFD
jgi:hypothetical protein